MKLRYSPTSPYVRKVAVTIHELGLDDKVERVMTAPWDAATDLGRTNPLGKVPALIADDGTVLYDSPVICEYLDSLVGSRLVTHRREPATVHGVHPVAHRRRWRNGDAALVRVLDAGRGLVWIGAHRLGAR